MFTEKLQELKRELMNSAGLVEDMIGKSLQGLLTKNSDLLYEIIEHDEPKANTYDKSIDEMCTALIAQFEPVASDLRTVLMILKMNKDLERMADHAVNIAESGLFLIVRPLIKSLKDIKLMADLTSFNLKNSINAFINADAQLARSICERDDQIDELGDKILQDLTGLMHTEHDGIKRALHHMRIAYNLERIADLSTNICEEVIYIVEGKDIKHGKNEV